MWPSNLRVLLGEVLAQVGAAALLADQGGADGEGAHAQHGAQRAAGPAGQQAGVLVAEELQLAQRAAQGLAVAQDAGVAGHQARQLQAQAAQGLGVHRRAVSRTGSSPTSERRGRGLGRHRDRALHGAAREDQALQQRVAGQPVGPVHAGAGHLAAGEQAPDAAAGHAARHHAADGVVRGRRDRDQVAA
jgi:hypothetical protein